MMEKEFDFQKIEDYVNNRLEPEARKDFEAEMGLDQELAREVFFYRDVADVTAVIGDEALAADIEAIGTQLETEGFFAIGDPPVEREPAGDTISADAPKVRRLPLRRIFSIAAGFALLIVAGMWWANVNYNDQTLALDHFDPDAGSFMVRNGGPSAEGVLSPGLRALDAKTFDQAARLFAIIPESLAAYGEARLYLAFSQFKMGNYADAASNAAIAAGEKTHFQERARWLQINAMLAAGQTDAQFENLLREMAENSPDNYYRNKASDLRKDYEALWRKLTF